MNVLLGNDLGVYLEHRLLGATSPTSSRR